eukprot:gene4567-7951_t
MEQPPKSEKHSYFGNCRSVEEFEKLNRIGEGTYGTVYRAKDTKTKDIVALKRIKMDTENGNGVPLTSIREISLLKKVSHPNIVQLKDVVVGKDLNSIFLVFEYCEHDLGMLLDTMKKNFSESEIKCLLMQILKSIEYLHKHYIIHRDIKLSNLLYNNRGEVKLADFGLARNFSKDYPQLTPRVVTLWYRSPEILLGDKEYTTSIDIWAVGCIFGELLLKEPLLPGKSDMHQLQLIFELIGYPSDKIWPDFHKLPLASKIKIPMESYSNIQHKFNGICDPIGLDLLEKMLCYDPKKRISASDALKHEYFKSKPYPKDILFMPTFKSTNQFSQ